MAEKRTDIRIKWWEDPSRMTYKSISVEPIDTLPEQSINVAELKSKDFYPETDRPVFFGHYWLNGQPSLFKPNVCCLDYSVAKGGKLMAYRHDGERVLDGGNIVYV